MTNWGEVFMPLGYRLTFLRQDGNTTSEESMFFLAGPASD
jgi:hypothetical protein